MTGFWDFFYLRLRSLPSPVFRLRELENFDETDWRPLVKRRILIQAPTPREIPDGRGRWLTVQRSGDRFFAVDHTEDLPVVVQLTAADLVEYTINIAFLAGSLCERNRIRTAPGTVKHGFIPLGRRSLTGHGLFSVFLSLADAEEESIEARLALLASSRGTKLVVFPVLPDVDRLDAFGASQLHLADLDEDLRINWPATLIATSAAEEDDYAFRYEGATWNVSYLGHSFTVPDGKGARYVAHLLQYPTHIFSASQLRAFASPQDLSGTAKLVPTRETELLIELSSQESIDKIRAQLAHLAHERETSADHPAELVEIEDEIAALSAELRRVTDHRGRLRYAGGTLERDRKSVTAAITRFVGSVQAVSEPVARYLGERINKGTQCTFTPADGEAWTVRFPKK